MMRIRLAVIGLVAVITVAGIGVVLFADETSFAKMFSGFGDEIGQARVSGSDEVALWVDGIPVTVAELLERKAQVEIYTERFDAELKELEAEGESIKELRGIIPAAFEYMDSQKSLLELYGSETIALADIMKQYSRYSAAIKAGYTISDDEVLAAVQLERNQQGVDKVEVVLDDKQVVSFSDTIPDYEHSAYIDAVGEKHYYTSVLPGMLKHDMIAGKWLHDQTKDMQSTADREEAMTVLPRKFLDEAVVELSNVFPFETTVEKAMEFVLADRLTEDKLLVQQRDQWESVVGPNLSGGDTEGIGSETGVVSP